MPTTQTQDESGKKITQHYLNLKKKNYRKEKKMARQKKDPFADLDENFKEDILAMNEEEIRDRIATTALAQADLMAAKSEDQALKEKQEEYKEAGAVYREGTKMNKLRISYARQVLEDRGKI